LVQAHHTAFQEKLYIQRSALNQKETRTWQPMESLLLKS
jgi:hypothetical protein